MKKIITEDKLTKIFCVFSMVLFAMLFYFSMVETWVNTFNLEDEYVYPQQDSVIGNLLVLVVVLLGISLLYQLGKLQKRKLNMDIVVGLVCLLAFVFSVYWVSVTDATPQADQESICRYAEEFENGNFEGLSRGQYAGLFRHQLGQITFMRLLFKIFGNGNYQAFQYLNAIMIPLLIFSGYQMVKKLSEDSQTAAILYLLLSATCVPLFCYVPFVYGELVSVTLTVFAAWMLLETFEKFSGVKVTLLSLALGAAVQFRKNTLILVIAFLIVLVIRLLREKNLQTIVTVVAILLSITLFQSYITGIYKDLIPADSPQVPSAVYIVMGTNDNNGMAGWHNYYDQLALANNDYDVEKANKEIREYLLAFGETCKEDPVYALDFYYRKICSQWNAPMYQSLAMNNKVEGNGNKLVESVYYGNLREFTDAEMNIHQLLVYGGVLFLLAMAGKKWKRIDNFLLLIGVFGGFLFSVMWEAKTRYVFPYYLAMLPYAAVGLWEMVKRINKALGMSK